MFSGKAFTAHEAVQFGLVDKISTFEEFRRERFKDTVLEEDRIMTAGSPRWFRFPDNSSDIGSLTGLFSQIASMDINDIVNLSIKETIMKAFNDMSPDQVRSAIDQLGSISAEYNIERSLSLTSFK